MNTINFIGTKKVVEIILRFNKAGKIRDAIGFATLTL